MRQIKFRVRLKSKVNPNEPITTHIYGSEHLFKRCWDESYWEMITRDEWTGFKDKNDRYIFEGDIVRDHVRKYVVQWNVREGGFCLEIINDEPVNGGIHQTHEKFPLDAMWLTVIGNIYETTALLTQ